MSAEEVSFVTTLPDVPLGLVNIEPEHVLEQVSSTFLCKKLYCLRYGWPSAPNGLVVPWYSVWIMRRVWLNQLKSSNQWVHSCMDTVETVEVWTVGPRALL